MLYYKFPVNYSVDKLLFSHNPGPLLYLIKNKNKNNKDYCSLWNKMHVVNNHIYFSVYHLIIIH